MTAIPVITLDVIRQRLHQPGADEPFVLHEFSGGHVPPAGECRMEVYFISFLHRGEVLVESDLVTYTQKAPALFAMAPSVIRRFVQGSRDFKIEVIFFEKAFFLQPLSDVTYLDKCRFFYDRDQHLLSLGASKYQDLCTYFDIIRQQVDSPGKHSVDVVRSVLQIILFEIATLHAAGRPAGASYSHTQLICSVFRQNLEKHFLTERKVSFYASLQHLSRKYFSAVIQQQTGKTAGALIEERVLLEARALLQNKELTIGQIADALGFEDASNFGNYFKNGAGLSPLNFRTMVLG